MKFIVGTHQYGVRDANIFIGQKVDQCTITLSDSTIDVDQMYEDIAPIVEDGFTLAGDEYTGYKLDSIQKHYGEEYSYIVVSLNKQKEETEEE